MTQPTTEKLVFNAKSGTVETSLLTPINSNGKLAVVLPGAGYSCKQPLLYFAIQVLLKKHFEVLTINNVYADDPKWSNLPTVESALRVVEEDSIKLFSEISQKFSCGIHTLLGRSLGTYAIACLLEQHLISPKQIVWQSPSLNGKWEIIRSCGIMGFGIVGTADERYESVKPHLPEHKLIVNNADHGMEIPNDPVQSIEILKRVTLATEEWLAP